MKPEDLQGELRARRLFAIESNSDKLVEIMEFQIMQIKINLENMVIWKNMFCTIQ